MATKLKGTGVALATPMNEDYSIDYSSFEKLVEHVINGGVDYLVVQGTTGESPTCSWEEKLSILDFTININKGRVPVVFGLGGNNTFQLIELARELEEKPIEAILSVSPYYSRPSQKALINHYTLLAEAFPRPIILYNVPARTGSNVEADTTLTLSEHPNIIGMKEASGNMNQCLNIIQNKSDDFLMISGDDQMTANLIQNGADGVISVVANLLPEQFSKMTNLSLQGQFAEAKSIDDLLQDAYSLLSTEGNPTSLKAALSCRSIGNDVVRPPLISGSEDLKNSWKAYLSNI